MNQNYLLVFLCFHLINLLLYNLDYYFELNKKETSSIMLLNEQGNFLDKRQDYLNDYNIIQKLYFNINIYQYSIL